MPNAKKIGLLLVIASLFHFDDKLLFAKHQIRYARFD